jgi:hypothetical protein
VGVINKDLALAIAKKLKARVESRSNRPHDIAFVYYEQQLIAMFGIRRGSKKEAGHDHIPRQIHVSPHDARLLGQCPLSQEAYFEKLKERGFIRT